MNFEDSLYMHAFNLFPQFGPARLILLKNHFKSFKEAYHANANELKNAGIDIKLAELFIDKKRSISLNEESEKLTSAGICLLSRTDNAYPGLLKEIVKFPPLLYVRGKMPQADELCLSVVGSRKITTYGLSVIPDLLSPIIEAGACIVSGMAFGVDSEAHKLCNQLGGRTIAVLGGGLDDHSLYPRHHQMLAHEIINNGGTLISEYPIGTPSLKQHFVARNRIISGMSVATLVIECDLKSGSLITAKYALEQNRSVFAVPGPIYAEMSKGPNNLIKMGARLTTEAKDILNDLNIETLPQQKAAQSYFSPTPNEGKLLRLLTKQPIHINILIQSSGLPAAEVASVLTFLEIKGQVRNLGGQQFSLSR